MEPNIWKPPRLGTQQHLQVERFISMWSVASKMCCCDSYWIFQLNSSSFWHCSEYSASTFLVRCPSCGCKYIFYLLQGHEIALQSEGRVKPVVVVWMLFLIYWSNLPWLGRFQFCKNIHTGFPLRLIQRCCKDNQESRSTIDGERRFDASFRDGSKVYVSLYFSCTNYGYEEEWLLKWCQRCYIAK